MVVVADSFQKDRAKDVFQVYKALSILVLPSAWPAGRFCRWFSHPPRCSKTKSWPNLDVGLSEIYKYIYILSTVCRRRAATASSIISILNFFNIYLARREPKAWRSIFVVKTYTQKMVDFQKTEHFAHSLLEHIRTDERTHTHTHPPGNSYHFHYIQYRFSCIE